MNQNRPSLEKIKGAAGEKTARQYLSERGWIFLYANYFTRFGELDLVMKEGDTLVFVEVKTRQNRSNFETSITRKKTAHLYKAAEIYIDKEKPVFKETRFDALYILINSLGKVVEIGHRPNFF